MPTNINIFLIKITCFEIVNEATTASTMTTSTLTTTTTTSSSSSTFTSQLTSTAIGKYIKRRKIGSICDRVGVAY
jgi:hypothetical protein